MACNSWYAALTSMTWRILELIATRSPSLAQRSPASPLRHARRTHSMSEPALKKPKMGVDDADFYRLPRQRFMRSSLLLMQPTDHHLRLASQIGVTDIVCAYPGSSFEAVSALKARIESFGLKFSVVERLVPHDKIVHNKPGRDEQIEKVAELQAALRQSQVDEDGGRGEEHPCPRCPTE